MRLGLLAIVVWGCTPAETPVVVVGAAPPGTPANVPPSAQSSPIQIVEKTTTNDVPFANGQVWVGRYWCAQGETELTLRIERVDGSDVDAVFQFFHESSGAEGSYRLHGRWSSPKRTIALQPREWIERPSGYIPVGMSGTVQSGRFSGAIDNDTCRDFSVTLEDEDEDRD